MGNAFIECKWKNLSYVCQWENRLYGSFQAEVIKELVFFHEHNRTALKLCTSHPSVCICFSFISVHIALKAIWTQQALLVSRRVAPISIGRHGIYSKESWLLSLDQWHIILQRGVHGVTTGKGAVEGIKGMSAACVVCKPWENETATTLQNKQ